MFSASFSPVCSGWWTKFYDRDDPTSGYPGDFELLDTLRNENPDKICSNPTAIDARVVGNHTNYNQTGQTLIVAPQMALGCFNDEQPNGTCLDYEVRFCCRSEFACFIEALCLSAVYLNVGFNNLISTKQ